jgi:hypothetical protein
MLGQSVLLSARSLSMINEAPAGSAADSPASASATVMKSVNVFLLRSSRPGMMTW